MNLSLQRNMSKNLFIWNLFENGVFGPPIHQTVEVWKMCCLKTLYYCRYRYYLKFYLRQWYCYLAFCGEKLDPWCHRWLYRLIIVPVDNYFKGRSLSAYESWCPRARPSTDVFVFFLNLSMLTCAKDIPRIRAKPCTSAFIWRMVVEWNSLLADHFKGRDII